MLCAVACSNHSSCCINHTALQPLVRFNHCYDTYSCSMNLNVHTPFDHNSLNVSLFAFLSPSLSFSLSFSLSPYLSLSVSSYFSLPPSLTLSLSLSISFDPSSPQVGSLMLIQMDILMALWRGTIIGHSVSLGNISPFSLEFCFYMHC